MGSNRLSKWAVTFLLLFTTSSTISFAEPFGDPLPPGKTEHLNISGCSVSNIGYLSKLTKEYAKRTGTEVFVRGGGSIVGLEDIRNKAVDIAAVCRSRMDDDPSDVDFVQVAWDALAFITHKSNKVEDITPEGMKSIIRGKIDNWKQLGGDDAPITFFAVRSAKSLAGLEKALRTMLLDGEPVETTPITKIAANAAMLEQLVETTPNSIGTSGVSSAKERNVKILRVNNIAATPANIVSGEYPYKRPLYLVVSNEPSPTIKRFLEFALSETGQDLIRSYGVVPFVDIKNPK